MLLALISENAHYIVMVMGAVNSYCVAKDAEHPLFWWAFPVGLLSEPFWIWETYKNAQWGMLALSLWFGFYWGKGAWTHRHRSPFACRGQVLRIG